MQSGLLKSIVQDGKLGYIPPLVSTESNSRSVMVIDSDDRLSGNPFAFVVDLQSNVPRARYVRLMKAIVPKLNNVNRGNNTLVIKTALGTTGTITIPSGMYNTNSMANEITAQINAAYALAGILDTVTTSFDTISRSFTITSVGGVAFFISDASAFILFGKNLVPFPSEPLANVPSTTSITSETAGMLSTRYFSVLSDGITKYQYSRSIVSSTTRQLSNICGVIDLANIYQPEDWDITAPYKGIYETVEVNGAYISVMNPQDQLERHLDVELIDGFGRSLNELFNVATALSVVMIFEILF